MARTVHLHLTNEDYVRIGMPSPPDYTPAPGHAKLYEAIGYLSSWNLSYPTVHIYTDDKYDLIAVYQKQDGERGYVIGAVWREAEGKYGFHS